MNTWESEEDRELSLPGKVPSGAACINCVFSLVCLTDWGSLAGLFVAKQICSHCTATFITLEGGDFMFSINLPLGCPLSTYGISRSQFGRYIQYTAPDSVCPKCRPYVQKDRGRYI